MKTLCGTILAAAVAVGAFGGSPGGYTISLDVEEVRVK